MVSAPVMSQAPLAEQEPLPAPRWRPEVEPLEIRVGAARTDNVRQEAAGETSDTILSAGIGVDYERDGNRLDATIAADIDWVEYADDTYDGQAFGYVDAEASFLLGGGLTWTARETFGQLATDPLEPATPDNLENLNYFTTGPQWAIRLGGATNLVLFGAYSKSDFEESPYDSEQYLGGISLARAVSARSQASLNLTSERVEFADDAQGSNYDLQSAYAAYEATGRRTTLSAQLGYTRIADDGDTSGGVLARLDLTRRVSASSSVFVRGRSQYSDAGSILRDSFNPGNPTSPINELASGNAFRENGFGIGWAFDRPRTRIGIGADWSDEDYELQDELNREVLSADAYAERRLGPTLTLRLFTRFESTDYSDIAFDEDQLDLGISLGLRVARTVSVDFEARRSDRSASTALADYTENRYGVRVRYSPLRR